MDAIFDLRNISYSYVGKIDALKGITLKIDRGERVSIIGSNGSGKSTLLTILNGLIYPTSGEFYAFGSNVLLNFQRQQQIPFAAAKIDITTLTSKDKLIAAAKTLQAANSSVKDFSGFYLPGQNWYALGQMIADEGGAIAAQGSDGKWAGTLESAASEKGIQDYVDYFKAGSTGPADNDEANPAQYSLFLAGKKPCSCAAQPGIEHGVHQVWPQLRSQGRRQDCRPGWHCPDPGRH